MHCDRGMRANTRNPILLTMFVALVAGIVGCGGAETKYEAMWGNRVDLRGVQSVVALYESHDGAQRRTVEDAMTRKLAERGVHAVPAYSVLDDNESADYKSAKETLAAKGFDAVLEIRLISKENETSTAYYSNTWDGWGYWGWGGPYAYDYYVFDTPVVRVETNLYSLHDDSLVWSGRTKTTDADTMREVVDQVTSVVAGTLEKRTAPTATATR
jgi:hypothetical protein